MKNDEIKEANRKALPKFLLFAVVCAIVGGVIGYYSGYGAAKGGMDELVGMMKETGAFFGTHIAPWLMVAIAIIVPVLCLRFIGVQRNCSLRGMARMRLSRILLTESCLS